MASPHWFPRQVRTDHPGFTVAAARGRVQLKVRRDGSRQSVVLPYSWHDRDFASALLRVREIAKNLDAAGGDLKRAAAIADGSSSRTAIDWGALIREFRSHLGSRVSEITWRKKYKVAIDAAMAALNGPTGPTTGEDLLDVALQGWQPGTVQEKHLRRCLRRFLAYGVEKRKLSAKWRPPALTESISTKPKRHGYPLTDSQVLRLIDACPDTEAGRRWRFALQLLSVYGLRPQDLKHLHTRAGGTQLWSGYRKSMGGRAGRRTEPRQLHALPVRDIDGTPVSDGWNLVERIHVGEALPPLGHQEGAAQTLGAYLRKMPVWQSIKAEAEREGQELVPYSFRHRFSAEAHKLGIQPKLIAQAMGHSLATHLSHYARFMSKDVEEAFRLAGQTPLAVPVVSDPSLHKTLQAVG